MRRIIFFLDNGNAKENWLEENDLSERKSEQIFSLKIMSQYKRDETLK